MILVEVVAHPPNSGSKSSDHFEDFELPTHTPSVCHVISLFGCFDHTR